MPPCSPARKTSTFGVQLKSVGPDTGDGAGRFKALVSAFNNVDSVGDVVMPGAFTKSLARWEEQGDPIPIIWSHAWSDPFANIGEVTKATETADGLEVEARLDLEGNPTAQQVHRLMRGRRLKSFSFAYDIHDAQQAQRDGKAIQELHELDILEIGPCLVGANRSTELLDVKAEAIASALTSDQLALIRDAVAKAHPETKPLTPAQLKAWATPTITPAALLAWTTERSPR